MSVTQSHLHVGHVGGADHILAASRADGVEAHGGEDVPGRHLAAVVVAAEAVDVVAVHAVHDFAQPVLRLPRLRGVHIKIRDVVAGLVALDVAAEHALAGDVLGGGEEVVGDVHGEERVELGDELLLAAHEAHEAVDVVGDVEAVVPRVALDEAELGGGEEAVGLFPGAVAVAGAGEADGGVEDVAVAEGSLVVHLGHVGELELLAGAVDAPVLVGIFEGDAGGGAVLVGWEVAQLLVEGGAAVVVAVGRSLHGVEKILGEYPVVRSDAFGDGVGEDADAVVAHHAPVLATVVAPDGEHLVGALGPVLEEAIDHVVGQRGVEEGDEGVEGAVGVPEREDGVVAALADAVVDLLVDAAVGAGAVLIERGVDQTMVERGVGHGALVVGALAVDDGEALRPGLLGRGERLVEGVRFRAVGVVAGAAGTRGREADDDFERVAAVVLELKPGHQLAAAHLGKVVLGVELVPEAAVAVVEELLAAVVLDSFVEGDVEIGVVGAAPAVGDAVALDGVVIYHVALCPEGFAVVVVEAVVEVEDNLLCRPLGEGVAMHAAVGRGGELAADVVVVEGHGIVARACHLGLVAETLAVAAVGVLLGAGVELCLARVGHDEDVAEVAVACAGEVGVAETHDGVVAVLITSAIVIDPRLIHAVDVVGYRVRVGAQLHGAVGVAGAGKGVPHAVSANKYIHQRGAGAIQGGSRRGRCCC